MIRKLNLPVLGVVETMSGPIFGEGGGERLAGDIDAPFLGSVPLNAAFREPDAPPAIIDAVVRAQFEAIAANLGAPAPAAR